MQNTTTPDNYYGTNKDDEGTDIAVDDAGNVFVTGFSNEKGTSDYHTFWLNPSNGSVIWDARYNSVYNRDDNAAVILIDGQGNLLVTGRTTSLDFESEEGYEVTTVKYRRTEVIEPPDEEAQSKAIAFIKNNGQLTDEEFEIVSDVKFYTRRDSPQVFFKNNGLSFLLSKIDRDTATLDTLLRVDMSFKGSTGRNQGIFASDERSEFYNYYLGHFPEGRERVPLFKSLLHSEAFTGIDIRYSSNVAGVKYYFIVKPGANPEDILLEFSGQDTITIGQNGELHIETSLGDIVLPEALAFQIGQQGEEETLNWTPTYHTDGQFVRFDLQAYDTSKPLVFKIRRETPENPALAIGNLRWSTYYGDANWDEVFDMEVAIDGGKACVYTTGRTNSPMFPTDNGPYVDNSLNGFEDAFVSKFDEDGFIKWSTYYGGNTSHENNLSPFKGQDAGRGIAVDKIGNVYVAGYTTSDDLEILAAGAAYEDDNVPTKYGKTFIVKFENVSGERLWSTYFGGNTNDVFVQARAVEVNSQNHLFIAGNYNKGADGDGMVIEDNNQNYFSDTDGSIYIAEFDVENSLVWSTFFGPHSSTSDIGESKSSVHDMAIDANDNLILVGTFLSGYTLTGMDWYNEGTGFQEDVSEGGNEGFVIKFQMQDHRPYWTTLIAGEDFDEVHGVDTDSDNNIFIGGFTFSDHNSFPIYPEKEDQLPDPGIMYENVLNSQGDAFIGKFTPNGAQEWMTYFGGELYDAIFDIAVTTTNYIFAGGITQSSDLAVMDFSGAYYQSILNRPPGANSPPTNLTPDGFILTLRPNLHQSWTTFLGGGGELAGREWIQNIDVAEGTLFASGQSDSYQPYFPTEDPLPLNPDNYFEPARLSAPGLDDAFISEFDVTMLTTITHVENRETNGFPTYPNPVLDFLYIDLGTISIKGNQRIKVFDMLGREMNVKILSRPGDDRAILDLMALPSGIYMVNILSDNVVFSQKVMKL